MTYRMWIIECTRKNSHNLPVFLFVIFDDSVVGIPCASKQSKVTNNTSFTVSFILNGRNSFERHWCLVSFLLFQFVLLSLLWLFSSLLSRPLLSQFRTRLLPSSRDWMMKLLNYHFIVFVLIVKHLKWHFFKKERARDSK